MQERFASWFGWSIHLNEFSGDGLMSRDCRVDSCRQARRIIVARAADNPWVPRMERVQPMEVPAIERKNRSSKRDGKGENGRIWNSLIGLSGFVRRQNIMPQQAKGFDDSIAHVFIGV